MSFADERKAIESRFAANFSALPVRYENQRFELPTAGGFVSVTIRPGDGRQASTGTQPLHRYTGKILIDVFVPEDTGTDSARSYADMIEAVFRRAQFSAGAGGSISCRTPSMTIAGVRDGWLQVSVSIPYRRDQIF